MKNFSLHAFCFSFFLGGIFVFYRTDSYRVFICLSVVFLGCLFFKLSSKSFYNIFILVLVFFVGYFISVKDARKIQCIEHVVSQLIRNKSEISIPAKIDRISSSDRRSLYFASSESAENFVGCGLKRVGFFFAHSSSKLVPLHAEVVVRGSVREIRSFKTDTDRWFDYEGFLSVEGVYFELNLTNDPHQVSQYRKSSILGLFGLRDNMTQLIDRLYEAPVSALVAGILLGEKKALGKKLSEAFQRTGLTHIVVLSGSNVSIILQTVMFFLRSLGRVPRFLFAITSITLFLFLVGFSPTTMRASAMAFIACSAQFFRRQYSVSAALALSAMVMVSLNPRILLSSPGFHLSFLATFALVFLSPRVGNTSWALAIAKKSPLVGEVLISSVSTQLITLPYMVSIIGNVSLISLIPNIVVLPLVPFAMLLSFLGIAFGALHFLAALPFVFLTTVLLGAVIWVIEWFSALSFAAVKTPVVSDLVLIIPYFLLFLWFFTVLYREAAEVKLLSITDQFRLAKKSST